MKALITGGSSGIGFEMAKYLNFLGHELILVGTNKEKLETIQTHFNKCKIIVMDLSENSKLKELYVLTKNEDIDILINCAGFGVHGKFSETDLNEELKMIRVNIDAVHMLTKLFLKDMKKKNYGYILNVSSSAAFQPGPLMAAYYATKAYVLRLTQAVYYELKKDKANVVVSCLCPGPVATNFNKRIGINFSVKPLKASFVAKYAIDKMFKRKLVIVPGIKMKLVRTFERFLPDNLIMKFAYNIQKNK